MQLCLCCAQCARVSVSGNSNVSKGSVKLSLLFLEMILLYLQDVHVDPSAHTENYYLHNCHHDGLHGIDLPKNSSNGDDHSNHAHSSSRYSVTKGRKEKKKTKYNSMSGPYSGKEERTTDSKMHLTLQKVCNDHADSLQPGITPE